MRRGHLAGVPGQRTRRFVSAVCVLLLLSARGTSAEESAAEPIAERSSTEINKAVTDPVSLTWSLKLKQNVTFEDVGTHGDTPEYTLQFQPTLPMLLFPRLKLIARPQFTLISDTPYQDKQGDLNRASAVGDTTLDVALAPSGPWLLGAGPTFVFPTANLDQTGQGKWQVGPAGVLGYRAERWLAVAIAQQWWSFAGASNRPTVAQLNVQYIASYFLADGWSVGTSPTIKVDWRASGGNQVTLPIGPTIGKVVKLRDALPVKFELQGVCMPVYPSRNGNRFLIQVSLTPVIPALLHGPLLPMP